MQGYQEDDYTPPQLVERGVIDILSETFSIYWKRFGSLVALVAVIQVPIGILELVFALVAPDRLGTSLAVVIIDVIASLFVYAAAICAVGQHYITNNVVVGECYARALWRVVSLAIFAMALGALLTLMMYAALTVSDPALTAEMQNAQEPTLPVTALISLAVILVTLPALVVFSIFMVIIIPALMMEGCHAKSALQRSFELSSNYKWRIFGHLLVYSLVAAGLFIALNLPLTLFGGTAASGEEQSFVSNLFVIGISRASSILIAPITIIATTLLYYDLRVRKEGYDMSRLSREMGIARV